MLASVFSLILATAAGSVAPVQAPLCSSAITIDSFLVDNSSANNKLVDDAMVLKVAVTSACQIQAVVADAFGHSSALSFDPGGRTWGGTLSLASDPHTAFTLTVTVTDINGATASSTRNLIHDTRPVVTVTLPTPSSVARPLIHVAATCSDDDPAGCATMTVSFDGTVLASGNPLDQEISLASLEAMNANVVLTFDGVDRRGQHTKAPPVRTTYVASNPRLSQVTHAQGQILDDSPDRTLFLNNDSEVSLLDKDSGRITPLVQSSNRRLYGRLTNHGAIFNASFPAPVSDVYKLFEQRDGVLTDFGQLNSSESLRVSGDYAIWSAGGPPNAVSLFRRDLQTGTTLTVASPPGVGNINDDVASNGDVVYWTNGGSDPYQIFLYRGGTTTQLTNSITRNVYPATDGGNVAYAQVDGSGNTATRLITDSADVLLADFTGWPDPPNTGVYAVSGGWTAFTKPIGADINVWLRAPDGTQSQVSFFGGRSQILAVNSDGAAALTHNGRLWLAEPNQSPTDVGPALWPLTRIFWRGNVPFVIIGAEVFGIADPGITTQPQSQTIVSGQTVTLTVGGAGAAPLSYQWYLGPSGDISHPIAGATSSSYTTPVLMTTTSYWVRVSNAAGTIDSNTATVTVVVPPAISVQPGNQTIPSGQTAALSVVASGTAPLGYRWYVGVSGNTSSPITGATASSYTTPALRSTTTYWVRVSNSAGVADSATATITVTPGIPPPSSDDLIVDFGSPYGIWMLFDDDPSTWVQLHTLSSKSFVTGDLDGNGIDELTVDFGPSYGIWIYYNHSNWVHLHTSSANRMAVGDLDGNGTADLLIDFPAFGVWIYRNNSSWGQLHTASADAIVTADLDGNGRDEAILDFPSFGLWVWSNDTSWSQLHPFNSRLMTTGDFDGNGQADLIVDFPGYGLWNYRNNSLWSQVHSFNASRLATGDVTGNGVTDLVVDFGNPYGIWMLANNTTWSQLHAFTSMNLLTSNIDGPGYADVIVNFGSAGLWAYANNTTWVQLHNLSPTGIAAGHINAPGP